MINSADYHTAIINNDTIPHCHPQS